MVPPCRLLTEMLANNTVGSEADFVQVPTEHDAANTASTLEHSHCMHDAVWTQGLLHLTCRLRTFMHACIHGSSHLPNRGSYLMYMVALLPMLVFTGVAG